jgi:hypothetical protein
MFVYSLPINYLVSSIGFMEGDFTRFQPYFRGFPKRRHGIFIDTKPKKCYTAFSALRTTTE